MIQPRIFFEFYEPYRLGSAPEIISNSFNAPISEISRKIPLPLEWGRVLT